MAPDFSQKTIDILSKRAVLHCSNPSCGVLTAGPNSDPNKATIIGEAAHIFGARKDSARYQPEMSDTARAEITNAIWLCRNCHKKVDRDPKTFPAELLFEWREKHEQFAAEKLGAQVNQAKQLAETKLLEHFKDYPPIIRRIVIDKPIGWEWRLTAELMRHLNAPLFRKLRDLRDNLYTRPLIIISENYVVDWAIDTIKEIQTLISPIDKLLHRLSDSWGAAGEPGNVDEIHHMCCLIRDYLVQIVGHEEQVYFTKLPNDFTRIALLMRDVIGSQADKLAEIPDILEQVLSSLEVELESEDPPTKEKPYVCQKTITIGYPENWVEELDREISRARKLLDQDSDEEEASSSWSSIFGFIIFLIVFLIIIL